MAAPPTALSRISLLAGPQLLGYCFSWGLHGVLCIQVYFYYLSFPKDRLPLKFLVYGVLIFECVQLGLVTNTAFQIYAKDFGIFDSIISYHDSWFSVPVMSSIIAAVVQCFYATRLWVLRRSIAFTVIIVLLSICSAGLGIAAGVLVHTVVTVADQKTPNKPITGTALIISTVVDIIIAVEMTYYLLHLKSGVKHSDATVNRLVRLIVETGTLTAAVSLLYSVLIMYETNNLLYQCPAQILPKVYSNSLLASLNNRAFVRANRRAAVNTDGAFAPSVVQPVFVPNAKAQIDRDRDGDGDGDGDRDDQSREDVPKDTLPVGSSYHAV